MSLRDRLVCLVDFIGITLLVCLPYASSLPPMAPFPFLLPLPNCFLSVCLPTLFAADLKDFLPLITSPISGAANSNMSATMRSADGTTYLRKKGIAVLTITCARAPFPFPSVFQHLYSMEFLFVLKQPSCSIVCVKNESWTPF